MAGKYALLIGNTAYADPKLADLAVPAEDVEGLRAVLARPDVGAFDEVKVLLNESFAVVLHEIGAFVASRRKDDLLLLYFSGHGELDASGQLYLALGETERSNLLGTAIEAAYLKRALDNSRSRRQVLVLDCCYSGAIGRGAKGSPALSKATFEVQGYGRTILTSSTATQLSWEGDRLAGEGQRSVFSHYLVEGLETGKAAPEGDEYVTVEDWYQYAHDQVVESRSNMTPERWVDGQRGALRIARNPHPAPRLDLLGGELLQSLEDGRYFVREGAARELGRILRREPGSNKARAAQLALQRRLTQERDRDVYAAIEEALAVEEAPKAVSESTLATIRKELLTAGSGAELEQLRDRVDRLAEVHAGNSEVRRLQTQIGEALAADSRRRSEPRPRTELPPDPRNGKPRRLLLVWAWAGLPALVLGFAVYISRPLFNGATVPEDARNGERAEVPAVQHPTGDVFRDCADCPEMVVVRAGTFQMVSPADEKDRDDDEGPVHEVTFADPFAIGKHEITNAQFIAFLNAVGRRGPEGEPWFETRDEDSFSKIQGEPGAWRVVEGFEDHPVVNVSWYGAKAYAHWLAEKTGKPYRLPSEAEWEYAARAGTDTAYWWGDTIGKNNANCRGCGSRWDGKSTAPVESFKPNAFGLYDTAGNVWEWVEDCWNASYRGAPADGGAWTAGDCGGRVLRGGSWDGVPGVLRSADRYRSSTGSRDDDSGFRVARTL